MKIFLFISPFLTGASLLGYFAPWYMNDTSVALFPHYLGLLGLMLLWPFGFYLLKVGLGKRKGKPCKRRAALLAGFMQAGLYLIWVTSLFRGFSIAI